MFTPSASAGPSNVANSSSPVIATSVPATPRVAFYPPLFGNFGKDAKDLFKKKYEFDNQAKFVTRPATGGLIETTVVFANDAPLRGVMKGAMPFRDLGKLNGTFESEFHTVADRQSQTSYKLTNLAKGLGVKVGLTAVKAEAKGETPDFPEGWISAEADYQRDLMAASVAVRSNGQKTLVDGVASVGYDNLSIGGKVTVDPSSKAAPQDYNFGAQLNGTDYVAAAYTEKKRQVLNLSYFQRLSAFKSRPHNFGAVLSFGLSKPTRSLTVGTDYFVDADTTVRAQAKVDSGKDVTVLQTAVEHRVPNPNVLLGVAAEFNVSPSAVSAGRVGVAITLGEF